MTPDELLAYCDARSVVLLPEGNQLKVNAPKQWLTPDLLDMLKQHKAELLDLLKARARGVRLPGHVSPAIDSANQPEPEATSGQRCRCGSADHEDVAIHDGQSTRRDCAHCGRFLNFIKWYGNTTNIRN